MSNLLIVATLAVGAVALLLRRPAGRWMVVTGAAGALVVLVTALVLFLVRYVRTEDDSTEAFLVMGIFGMCCCLLGPVLTLMCTLAESTGAWLRRGRGLPAEPDHPRS